MQFVFCSKAAALLSFLCNSLSVHTTYIFKAKVRQTSVLEHNLKQALLLVSGVPCSSLIGQHLLTAQPFTDRTLTSRPREKTTGKNMF